MVEDYRAAEQLLQQYPDRFKVVRYEDFTLGVNQQAPDLFHFLEMPLHQKVQTFLESHQQESWIHRIIYDECRTHRDMNATALRWTHELSFAQVFEIQNACQDAIKLWGYKEVKEEDELRNDFNPLFTLTSDLQVMD